MFYGLHTTKGVEREAFLKMPGVETTIDPSSFHRHPIHKSVVWEEDTGKFYEHPTAEFFEALKEIDEHRFNPAESSYYKRWSYKGEEPLVRMTHLSTLYHDIKEHGIHSPVHCTLSGNRLDGSFRTKIAMHLGLKEVPAIIHEIDWREITQSFIERYLTARAMSSGPDYYSFDYGNGLWNVKAGKNYQDNTVDRWNLIQNYITGSTLLDLGCNEAYLSLQAARQGMKVVGYDEDWNHLAYFNRLVYSFLDRKDLDATFIEGDVRNVTETADTVLILNLIYHIPRADQVKVLAPHKGKNVIFQCNLDKEAERATYYGSHPADLMELIGRAGMEVKKVVEWGHKPLILAS